MVSEKLDGHVQSKKPGPLSSTIHKIQLKWIKYLNVIPETKRFLEENIDGLSDAFWIWHQKQMQQSKNKQVGVYQTQKASAQPRKASTK